MKRLISFWLLLFALCIGVQAEPSQLHSIKEILQQIPHEDYDALDRLFRHLIFESYFAYTLFGSKPMTHRGAFLDMLSTTQSDNGDFIFLSDWKIWKKYASIPEFQMSNFAFVEKQLPNFFEIHFLNRKKILQCVQDHLATFQDILGKSVTPEKVFESMLYSEGIFDALGKSQVLLGILFGFGEKNAKGFHEKFILGMPLPEPKPFNDEEPQSNRLPLPYFQTFSERERKELKNRYQSERKHILFLYSQGDFLEITLNRLTASSL